MLGPILKRKSDLSIRNGIVPYKHLIRPMMDYACHAWWSTAGSNAGGYRCYNPSVFASLLVPLVRKEQADT